MKKGIIVASFGTTYEEARRLSIESIEDKIKEKYKDYLVLRAFTSRIVVKRLKDRDNLHILNEVQAVEEMKNQGIEDIYIQPLHIIPGHEYGKLVDLNEKTGKPLLSSEEDYIKIAKNIGVPELENNDALVFMGHGSDHEADVSYEILEKTYRKLGHNNIFIGTVEGSRTIEEIIEELKEKNHRKIKLKPFMLVAGDHALNDMASDEEDSWKSILEKAGFEVEICLKSLGQYEIIHNIFIEHLKEILGE